jgi:hypothetical protein
MKETCAAISVENYLRGEICALLGIRAALNGGIIFFSDVLE